MPSAVTETIRYYVNLIRNSLWFAPTLMAAGMFALARAALTWGKELEAEPTDFWFIYSGEKESARDLLTSLLTGMMTMTSLVVSITMVVLTLAAGQLGARVVGTFIRDSYTQATIGLFIGTIVYLVMVVRDIDEETIDELPHLAITGGSLLSVVCLLVLVPYVHRLARTIMHDHLIDDIRIDAIKTIERLMPREPETDRPWEPTPDVTPLPMDRDGYVTAVDFDQIAKVAKACRRSIWVVLRAGDHVAANEPCALVENGEALTAKQRKSIRKAFTIGAERSGANDVGFGIGRLNEIIARSLSSGINDPYTARTAIDAMSSVLVRVLSRHAEGSVFHKGAAGETVVRRTTTPGDLLAMALDEIRPQSIGEPQVLAALLRMLKRLEAFAREEPIRRAPEAQRDEIMSIARHSLKGRDLALVENVLRGRGIR